MNFVSSLAVWLPLAACLGGTEAANCFNQGNSNDAVPELPQGTVNCAAIDIEPSLEAIAAFLLTSFDGKVIDPTDTTEYDAASKQYASASTPTTPSYIVQASNELDVQATVIYASYCDVKLTTRSGGHSYLGISSCDSSEGTCIQLDVGAMDDVEVIDAGSSGKKKLRVGPGIRLEDFASECAMEGVFIPGGQCTDIGVGGHVQTGGYGPYSRTFGVFSHYVDAFNIVLADGSVRSVTRPEAGSDKSNADLYYAVLGGASGSFGVITEVTFDTLKDDDYFSVYWEVNFVYNNETLPGIKEMFRKFAEVAKSSDEDTNWNVWWTLIAAKTLLNGAFAPLLSAGFEGFNYMQLEIGFVRRKHPNQQAINVLAEAQAFYDAIASKCAEKVGSSCLLDDYIDNNPLKYGLAVSGFPPPISWFQNIGEYLKVAFASTFASQAPISETYRDVVLFDFEQFGIDPFPYKTSWQQGPSFPDEDGMEGIIDKIDGFVPQSNEPRFLILQVTTLFSEGAASSDIALPHQDGKIGVVFDQWDLTGSLFIDDFADENRMVQDYVISVTGEVDNRMFWGAYEEPDLTSDLTTDKYYESNQKYQRLVKIKTCVDPNNVFESRMSLPVKSE